MLFDSDVSEESVTYAKEPGGRSVRYCWAIASSQNTKGAATVLQQEDIA